VAVNQYVLGTAIEVSVAFTNAAGAPADPTLVTLAVTDPAGAETTYDDELSNPAVGSYLTTFVADQVGDYRYRFEGTGALVAATEGVFTVWSSY
jgi:hypothetical protein